MSKWRPNSNGKNIYCIPDLHANYFGLKLILDRIIPLKKDSKLIFLGDYIDRGNYTFEVLEILINLRKKYSKEQVIFLKGNHEQFLLNSLGLGEKTATFKLDQISDYSLWINNGGVESIQSWAKHKGVDVPNPKELTSSRCLSFVDEKHIKFLQEETQLYYELIIDDHKYQFAHASIDPDLDLDKQSPDILMWDRSLYTTVKSIINQGKELPWAKEKTIITGHNYEQIYFTPGYLMADSSAKSYLPVIELNTMSCMLALNKNTDRLVKYTIPEAKPNKSVVKRIT